MNRTIFEQMDRLEIEMLEGGVLLQQFDSMGDVARIFIPGRYVAEVVESIANIAELDLTEGE